MKKEQSERDDLMKTFDTLTRYQEENKQLRSELMKIQQKYENIKVLYSYFKTKFNHLINEHNTGHDEDDSKNKNKTYLLLRNHQSNKAHQVWGRT